MILKNTVVLCVLTGILHAQTPDFEAKGLLYVQDSDFNSSTNSTKQILKNGLDWVGGFTFPLDYTASQNPSQQNISNSILSNHRIVAVGKDNKNTYVLETKGSLPKGQKDLSQLPNGGYVSVIRTSNLTNINPEYRFPVADSPTAIALDPTNKFLAVASSMSGNEIQIFELDDFGKPLRMLPRVTHFEGSAVNDILWHPNKDFLIYIKKEDKELGLIRIVRDKTSIIRMEQYGDVVKFEGNPVSAVFSKDEKNLFVLDAGTENTKGAVFHVRLNLEENGKHSLISRALVEENPQHITIHPSGEFVVVTNFLRSDSKKDFGDASLSILRFKNENIENILNYHLSGVFPSQVKFDKTGRNFAISYFQSKAYGKPVGLIDFYKFSFGHNVKIERQNASINVPVGVHYLEVFN
jgi:DNA-binding beta-propeller fold protein YncE